MAESDPAGVEIHGTRVRRVTFYGRGRGVEPMTDQERAGKIRALLEERAGYEARGQKDRVAQVSEQLRALGAEGAAPASRAEKRPAADASEKRSAS